MHTEYHCYTANRTMVPILIVTQCDSCLVLIGNDVNSNLEIVTYICNCQSFSPHVDLLEEILISK